MPEVRIRIERSRPFLSAVYLIIGSGRGTNPRGKNRESGVTSVLFFIVKRFPAATAIFGKSKSIFVSNKEFF